jgi:tRNA dimethylallyltransferase
MQKKLIVIGGPTAVGKTAVAIAVAKHFNTEIISADSRQCFKELNIGVARPSLSELATVPHHFIADRSIQQEFSASDYEKFALKKLEELFSKRAVVVMVGGTGLYIKALAEGLDNIPEIEPELRERIRSSYEKNGMQWLVEELKLNDPLFVSKGEMQNPQRMLRALEVVLSTGESILQFQTGVKAKRDFEIIYVGLDLPREELHSRINARVDQMIQQGLLAEVKSLIPYQHLNALQTVGYKEMFEHLQGEKTLEEAAESIKAHTRQYAKRQLTWFKKVEDINWFHPSETEKLLSFIKEKGVK